MSCMCGCVFVCVSVVLVFLCVVGDVFGSVVCGVCFGFVPAIQWARIIILP